MVPHHYVTLPRLPLTGNGKVDRRRRPAPAAGTAAPAGTAGATGQPRTSTERLASEVFREVLGVPTLGPEDSFFDVGGHSIAAIQAVSRLRRALPGGPEAAPAFGVADLFRHPTVREFAALVDRPADAAADTDSDTGAGCCTGSPRPGDGTPTVTYVCVPYGGGQPMVYQPLADALPADRALYAVSIPGDDPTRPDEVTEPIEVVAGRLAEEITRRVAGPLVLYGHCGIGGALAVETARRLEAAVVRWSRSPSAGSSRSPARRDGSPARCPGWSATTGSAATGRTRPGCGPPAATWPASNPSRSSS